METLVFVLIALFIINCIIVLCFVHECKQLSEKIGELKSDIYLLEDGYMEHTKQTWALYCFMRRKFMVREGVIVGGMDDLEKAFEKSKKQQLDKEE